MMKRKYHPQPTRLAVVLVSMFMLLMAACSDKDIASFNNPLGSDIYGVWYADYQASGTIGSDNIPYSRVLQAVKLNSDGTGKWWKAVFNDHNATTPLQFEGGQYDGAFDYTVAADGTITAKPQKDISSMPRSFRFANGAITFDDNGAQTMKAAPEGYEKLLQQLEAATYGASADNYNINDKDITAQNWRQTEAIYIYDGVGTDVTDEKGRTGYTTVNLPWYNGTKQTNLPEGFCDDITPEMGWEWVANYCGNRSVVNNNFFALYNKYTGILRFFYYMPQGTSTGNDHVWQVSMTDNLATHTTIPYGVPDDRTLTNKAAINQTGQGTFMDYITPWVDYRSNDGLIVPNDGWWAFDVDLSLTRSETINEDDNIKLQMRSWNTQHTSLYSTMMAKINGEMKGSFEGQTKTPLIASSSKGLFGRVGDLVKLGTKITNTVKDIYSGNAVGAIKGGVDLAKNGASLASGKTKASGGATSGTFDGTFEGTINMMMNGTINTDGVIQGSQPTVGVASPTFYLKDFDTKNSHVGQGVWNIKKTPMVYAVNSQNNMDFVKKSRNDYYYAGNWLFFDPSSVEVVLNPNVFPDDQIEWMQVDAIAGARQEMNWTGTDPFRQAIGMEPLANKSYTTISEELSYFSHHYGDEVDNYVFNFVGAGDFDGQTIEGTNYRIEYPLVKTDYVEHDGYIDDNYQQELHIFGCGTEDYVIEPQMSCWNMPNGDFMDVEKRWEYKTEENIIYLNHVPFRFPAVEINVTVQVKLKSLDLPIILSRIYLPDYQYLEICTDEAKVLEVIDRIYAKKNLSPKTAGHTQSYDFQAARINKCFKLLTGFGR